MSLFFGGDCAHASVNGEGEHDDERYGAVRVGGEESFGGCELCGAADECFYEVGEVFDHSCEAGSDFGEEEGEECADG